MQRTIALTLNGKPVSIEAEETASLLDVLRNDLKLLGARYGCGSGECGTCAVMIDGEDKPSCQAQIQDCIGKTIVTVEGIGTMDNPHPLQAALLETQAGQCGYCLTGIVVGAKALLDKNPSPTRKEVADALAWHLCRCGVHNRILDAILLAAGRMNGVRA